MAYFLLLCFHVSIWVAPCAAREPKGQRRTIDAKVPWFATARSLRAQPEFNHDLYSTRRFEAKTAGLLCDAMAVLCPPKGFLLHSILLRCWASGLIGAQRENVARQNGPLAGCRRDFWTIPWEVCCCANFLSRSKLTTDLHYTNSVKSTRAENTREDGGETADCKQRFEMLHGIEHIYLSRVQRVGVRCLPRTRCTLMRREQIGSDT